MNTTEYPEAELAGGENSSWSLGPEAYYIHVAGIVPLACLGLLGNLTALAVWMAAIRYNATILLFKFLCVWDNLFLLTLAIHLTIENFYPALVFAIGLSQLMSAHLTLIIMVTRLLAVTRPLHVRNILTRRLVHVIHVGTVIWCSVLESLEIVVILILESHPSVSWALFVFKEIIGLILPLTALLIVNVCLLGFVHRLRAITRSSLQRRPSQPSLASERRLNLAVICISVCTLIAYPVGITFKLVTQAAHIDLITIEFSCDRHCVMTVDAVFLLLQTLNSSVNIVFYALFSTQFRHLLVSRAQRVRGLGRSLITLSFSSSTRRTGVTGV